MAKIAREAGISKALLYHYFPSKQAYFAATLEQAAAELAEVTRPDPERPPVEQLARSLDAYLGWVERHMGAYDKLIRSVGAVPEVRELVERVRDETADRILAGIAHGEPAPPLRAAVRGWLWFMDGVVLDWIEHRDIDRARLHGLLLGTLLGAVTASGEPLRSAADAQHEDRAVVARALGLEGRHRLVDGGRHRVGRAARGGVDRVAQALLAEALAARVARVDHAVGVEHERVARREVERAPARAPARPRRRAACRARRPPRRGRRRARAAGRDGRRRPGRR